MIRALVIDLACDGALYIVSVIITVVNRGHGIDARL